MILALASSWGVLLVAFLSFLGSVLAAFIASRANRSAAKSDALSQRIDAALAGQGSLIDELQSEIGRLHGQMAVMRDDKTRIDRALDDCRANEEMLRARVHRLERKHDLEP